jgi:hypothetical protein
MHRVTWVVLAVVSVFALHKGAACVWPHSCTEIGCGDGVSVTLAFADRRWPNGEYVFEVVLDDVTHTCAFSWPVEQPTPGGIDVPCDPGELEAFLRQEVKCTEQRTADAVTQSCALLDGQYSLQLSRAGTPKSLELHATRDGERLKDLALDLEYSEERPNGPDCEPLCWQSSQELQLD